MKPVLIDSRPRLEGVLAALLPLGDGVLLERHLRLARKMGAKDILILEDEPGAVSGALSASAREGLRFSSKEPAGDFLRLSTQHVYREAVPSVIWTLRNARDLKNAQGEIERSELFTISKHTLRPLGRLFAQWAFAHTGLNANHLTWARIAVGLTGAWLFYRGSAETVVLAGVCVLASWFLDLTDGQLARLRGETSKFGSYLDSVGDGVVDNLYYVAIAAAAWRGTGDGLWVWMGLAFLFGKYVFVNSTLLAPRALLAAPAGPKGESAGPSGPRLFAKRLFSLLDETDVRIHLLAVCALFVAPLAALVFHVFYFNLRWILNLINAYYKFEIKKETA